ncbi:MAG: 50S ribosomal protein L25 [Anaerolineales bacterium]|nr:50S ribosomal protein L25 [Anaerolineales bacterium]
MDKFYLPASKREITGKKVKALRRDGKIPAVVYGSGIEPTSITLDYKQVRQTLDEAGANTLLTIDMDGQEFLVLVREKQREVISRNLLHVDFQAVSLEELITTTVRVNVEGEAPAVSEYNALLVTELDELTIEAKAQDLPDSISVDVTGLTEIGDNILIRDLKVSDKVKILEDPDEIVIVVASPTVLEIEIEEEEETDLLEELEDAELLEELEEGEIPEDLLEEDKDDEPKDYMM